MDLIFIAVLAGLVAATELLIRLWPGGAPAADGSGLAWRLPPGPDEAGPDDVRTEQAGADDAEVRPPTQPSPYAGF